MRPEKPRSQPVVAIAAIVKDEGPYLLEWIAYHRALGVSRFFIADNNSTDGTRDLLQALRTTGYIEFLDYPGSPGVPPQLPAYFELLDRFGSMADWMAFIDADEFLLPDDPSLSIPQFFARFGTKVGAVAVNWAIYGSSGRDQPGDGLVIERFNSRAERAFVANHHYKSVVRPSAFAGLHVNPHRFRLRFGYRYRHADGTRLWGKRSYGSGLSAKVCWEGMRLNHYVVKSRAEFAYKKAARGRATTVDDRRGDAFFTGHDRNEDQEPMPEQIVRMTLREMENMRAVLRRAHYPQYLCELDRSLGASLTTI